MNERKTNIHWFFRPSSFSRKGQRDLLHCYIHTLQKEALRHYTLFCFLLPFQDYSAYVEINETMTKTSMAWTNINTYKAKSNTCYFCGSENRAEFDIQRDEHGMWHDLIKFPGHPSINLMSEFSCLMIQPEAQYKDNKRWRPTSQSRQSFIQLIEN